MANIQVTHDSSLNNARSESSIVVNPNNPMQIVSASKKFNNIATYDFTLATQYSDDGGHTWHDSAALGMSGFTVMTDPTMAWDDSGNVFMVGLAGNNPPKWDALGMVVYKSTDGGKTWSAPKKIHTSVNDDKQWAAGDTNSGSPHHGNVYAAWDDGSQTPGLGWIAFARTKDHGATWIGAGPGTPAAGGMIVNDGSHFPEVNVADDGTIYIVSIAGSDITLYVSTDGGDTFTKKPNPATGIHPLEDGLSFLDNFPVFPGGTFRVITDPTACAFGNNVMVAWADLRKRGRRGRLAHLLLAVDRRRQHLVEPVRTTAVNRLDSRRLPALPSPDHHRPERRHRLHVLRVRAEAHDAEDRRDCCAVVRRRRDLQPLHGDRPAVGSEGRCALLARRPDPHVHRRLLRLRLEREGLLSTLDGYTHGHPGALHGDSPGEALRVHRQPQHDR